MEDIKNLIIQDNVKIEINGRICHHKIKILYGLAKYFNLNKYIEIGVHNGSSMAYTLQSPSISECVGIDPFEDLVTNDPHMKHYQNNDKITLEKTKNNIMLNNKFNAKINLIKDYSENTNIDNLDNDYDLLFIDGNHNYKYVMNDFNKFKNVIKSGGYIVFDDLHQDGPKKAFFEILKNDKDIKLFGIFEKTEGILIKN